MSLKRYDRRYLPMLWIGLALWLGSMLILGLMTWTGYGYAGQENLMDEAKSMFLKSPIGSLLLLCLFQPILEEFSFRLWATGTRWKTIVCLILMTLFAVGTIGFWGVLMVAVVLVVWLLIKDLFVQRWVNAIITSVCFSLCHISGFGSFSVGMVMGLVEIFGLALVLCWLTINFSIWLSALLHVLNNSLGLILPLIFVSDPVTLPCYSVSQDGKQLAYNVSMSPVSAFADNEELFSQVDNLNYLDSTTTSFYLVGEPAEIAERLMARLPSDGVPTHYDWSSKGEMLEERIVFRVDNIAPNALQYEQLWDDYQHLVKKYTDSPLTFDTSEVMLKSIWLVFPDGRELPYEDCGDYRSLADIHIAFSSAGTRGYTFIDEIKVIGDSTTVNHEYCIVRPNPMEKEMASMNKLLAKTTGFHIEYRDVRKMRQILIKN